MKIAIPCRRGRISPVLDVAKDLLLVEVKGSQEVSREYKSMRRVKLLDRGRFIFDLGADVLICGALSAPLQMVIEARGIRLIRRICGNVEDILRAFLNDRMDDPALRIPGSRAGQALGVRKRKLPL